MTTAYASLPLATRADLFAHLAAMEQAGLPPDKAFALLKLPAAAARIDNARKLLARGIGIADAGQRSGLFTDVEAKCLRAAIHAGSPLATYRRLAALHAERARLASAMRMRMLLPLALLAIALLLRPLPALVAGSIGVGGYLIKAAWPLALLGIGYALAIRAWRQPAAEAASDLRLRLDRALLGLPLFGKLIERADLRDFVEHLAILLDAGVPMFEAIPLAQDTMGNAALRADHAGVLSALRGGATLAQALETLRHPGSPHLVAVISTGEQAGRLPEALFRHAAAEAASLSLHYEQIAVWLPRAVYALVLAWIAWGVLASRAFMPGGGAVF